MWLKTFKVGIIDAESIIAVTEVTLSESQASRNLQLTVNDPKGRQLTMLVNIFTFQCVIGEQSEAEVCIHDICGRQLSNLRVE